MKISWLVVCLQHFWAGSILCSYDLCRTSICHVELRNLEQSLKQIRWVHAWGDVVVEQLGTDDRFDLNVLMKLRYLVKDLINFMIHTRAQRLLQDRLHHFESLLESFLVININVYFWFWFECIAHKNLLPEWLLQSQFPVQCLMALVNPRLLREHAIMEVFLIDRLENFLWRYCFINCLFNIEVFA